MNQDWNDAKSQLQQCCLTLRDAAVGDPDIPIYKSVILLLLLLLLLTFCLEADALAN